MDKEVIIESFEQSIADIFEEGVFLPDANFEEDLNKSMHTDALELYRKYMKDSTVFKVKISRADNKGNLYIPLSGNITGYIPNEEVFGQAYDFRKRSLYVGQPFAVVVTDVDANTVYLSRYRAKLKSKEILKEKLKKGVKVKARVEFYQEKNKRVYINIEGCGILGFVRINEWSHRFIDNPSNEIEKASIVNVEIMRYLPAKGGIKESYECSRKACTPDPWITVEDKYHKNDIIVIVADYLHADKFFGRIPGEELDIYVEYPNKKNNVEEEVKAREEADIQNNYRSSNIIVRKGRQYKVIIYKVSAENKILRARVIDEVPLER